MQGGGGGSRPGHTSKPIKSNVAFFPSVPGKHPDATDATSTSTDAKRQRRGCGRSSKRVSRLACPYGAQCKGQVATTAKLCSKSTRCQMNKTTMRSTVHCTAQYSTAQHNARPRDGCKQISSLERMDGPKSTRNASSQLLLSDCWAWRRRDGMESRRDNSATTRLFYPLLFKGPS